MGLTRRMIPQHWQPYYRMDDGELVGYLESVDAGLVRPRTIFGYPLAEPDTEFAGEATLEQAGLRYLAEDWGLRQADGTRRRVRIAEASPSHLVVLNNDFRRAQVNIGEPVVLAVPVAADELVLWGRG